METELKLALAPDARPLVETHPLFAAAEARSHRAISTYYDTPDCDLYRMGASLRVRQSGDTFVQTVKLDRPGHAIGVRGEWEWTLRSADPDYSRLAELPEEAAAVAAFAGRLKPVVATEIERTTRLLHVEGGTTIEAVIDQGQARAGAESLDISEVELELKQGSSAELFRLAIDLAERAPLRFEARSKSERGYGLLADALPKRKTQVSPVLDETIPIGEVFPLFVHAALRDLADEMPPAGEGDIEGVHRMRAAIRKLRSILVLFDPYLDRQAARRFNASLRELGRVLGEGRDWDVFLTETLPRVEAKDDGADVAPLRTPAEELRAKAHAAIAEAVRGRAVTGLILGLGGWTASPHWLCKVDPATPFADLVPTLLDGLERKARRRAKKLDTDDAEQLHTLRKSLKKLRYSAEYASPLFEPEAVDDYLHAMKGVLGLLGDINDAAVAEHRVNDIVSARTPDLAPAAAVLVHQVERLGSRAVAKLPKRLRKLQEVETFWR